MATRLPGILTDAIGRTTHAAGAFAFSPPVVRPLIFDIVYIAPHDAWVMVHAQAAAESKGIDPHVVCFRFFSIDRTGAKATQERSLFVDHRLYFAQTSQYSDRAEFAFDLAPSSFRDWIRQRIGIEIAAPEGDPLADADQAPAIRAAIGARLDTGIRVCCFTDDPRSRHMCAHYAANFTGYMVAFRVASLHGITTIPRPVEYTDLVPLLDANTAFDDHEDFTRVVFRKGTAFAPEQEFRSVLWTPEPHDGWVQLPADAIAFVVLGHEMDEGTRRYVESLVLEGHPNLPIGITIAGDGELVFSRSFR